MIYTKNLMNVLKYLNLILDVLRKEKWFANLKKYTFWKNKLVFLGLLLILNELR